LRWLLDLVCDKAVPESLRKATIAALKTKEQLPDDLVRVVYGRLNLPAPRIRSKLPGAEVTPTDNDTVEISLRRKEPYKASYTVKVTVTVYDEDEDRDRDEEREIKFKLQAKRKKPMGEKIGPQGDWRPVALLMVLAEHAVAWTMPSWLTEPDEGDTFDIIQAFAVDALPLAA
jgi:hypothetical protein